MHFSHMNNGGSTQVTKIAIVAAFHVVLAFLLIKSMNARMITMPKMPEEVVLLFTPEPPPPPPPEPPKPMPKVAPPQIVAPPPEVEVTQPPPPNTVTAQVTADPAPAQPQAAPVPASSNPGAMRTAVLADANGCAIPEYPPRAARNGESGTVTLALLVGTDGRVAGSRVQNSSGSRELDKAAIAALSLCKFKPATAGGVAEQAWAQIAYVWTLEQ